MPKSNALLAAEAELAAQRTRRDQLIEQTDTLRAIPSEIAAYPRVHDKELRVLERERADVDRKIKLARAAVAAAQAVRARQVAEALEPLRALAEAEVWGGLETIIAAWRVLDEIERQTTLAGGAGLASDRPDAQQLRTFLRFFIAKGAREPDVERTPA